MREELEDAREHLVWTVVLRGMGTAVLVLSVIGALSVLTLALGWSSHLLLCAVGLVAGAAVAVAATGSARGRERTALVLGTITLPFLAAHLAAVGARDEAAFGAYSARLGAFLAHAAGGLLGGVAVAAMWRGLPRLPRATPDEAAAEGAADAIAAPARPAAAGERRSTRVERTELPSAGGASP